MSEQVGHISADVPTGGMTYLFKVVLEPDGEGWHVYCPALLQQGASTWGSTRREALTNIEEVTRMVIESLIEHNDPLPDETVEGVQVSQEPQVAVTLPSF